MATGSKGGVGTATGSISASADLLSVRVNAIVDAVAAPHYVADASAAPLYAARFEQIYLPNTPHLATIKLTFDAQLGSVNDASFSGPFAGGSFAAGYGRSGQYDFTFPNGFANEITFQIYSGGLNAGANAQSSEVSVHAHDESRATLRLTSIKVVDPILGEIDPDSIFFGSRLGDTPPPDPGPIPDIIANSIARTADNGVDFSYSIANAPLPRGTNVSLYWSADDKFDPGTDTPTGYSVAAQTSVGSYGPFHVDASTLGTPPQGATHLLVVADPPSSTKPSGEVAESNEGNNVQSTPFSPDKPDLILDSVDWDSEQGGVNLTYEIKNNPLPSFTDISFFWASGNILTTAQIKEPAGPIRSTGVNPGQYPLHIPASEFKPPPEGTSFLIVALDRLHQIGESDEFNNGDYKGKELVIAPPTIRIEVKPSRHRRGSGTGS